MKINDSTYSPQALQTKSSNAVQQQTQKEFAVSRVENNNKGREKSTEKQRFDANEKALALVKEQSQFEQSSENVNNRKNTKSTFSQYDQPSKQNQSAVAAYQSVDNIAQRENIKQFFGVNLFA